VINSKLRQLLYHHAFKTTAECLIPRWWRYHIRNQPRTVDLFA